MPILSTAEIAAFAPAPVPPPGADRLAIARARMQAAGQWQPWQTLGQRMTIGCVALEITQRCNLDCTYCYLSESSEALKDVPLAEVLRRIDEIVTHYGPGTDVQITGGEPTLRRRDELVAIVRHAARAGLRPALFTNGIKVTRELLSELSGAGLVDVAFHVDLTQQRPGYPSEAALNGLRLTYMRLADGLPLAVMFNTTVFTGNIAEIPALAAFFVANADRVRLASFQLGADAGRGTAGSAAIDPPRLIAALQSGARCALNFDAMSAGHRACNRYAMGWVVNGRVYDALASSSFTARLIAATGSTQYDRRSRTRAAFAFAGALLARPWLAAEFLLRAGRVIWAARRDLVAAGGRIGKISFFVHDFMDSRALDQERCAACSFMVMTGEGPLSMCVHNAKRDAYLLKPTRLETKRVIHFWSPVTGALTPMPPTITQVTLGRKTARGRARARGSAAATGSPQGSSFTVAS